MTRPSWDAAELARSALSEMTAAERVAFMVGELRKLPDLGLIAGARNNLTDHMNDLIADRYADHLLGEDAA